MQNIFPEVPVPTWHAIARSEAEVAVVTIKKCGIHHSLSQCAQKAIEKIGFTNK